MGGRESETRRQRERDDRERETTERERERENERARQRRKEWGRGDTSSTVCSCYRHVLLRKMGESHLGIWGNG